MTNNKRIGGESSTYFGKPAAKLSDKEELVERLYAMFYKAMLEWKGQGRSDEQIHAVNNFNTGVGVKLREAIATAWLEDRENYAQKSVDEKLRMLRKVLGESIVEFIDQERAALTKTKEDN